MTEPDTVRLLRECDSGIKMGISSIEEVIDRARDRNFRQSLLHYKKEHEALREEMQALLERCHDDGKEPPSVAKGMAWVKTNVKIAMDESDSTIADLMLDGCNMGVKSISKFMNQYAAADKEAREIAGKLVRLEEKMSADMRAYL